MEDANYIVEDLKSLPAFQQLHIIKTTDITDCLFALFKSLLLEEKIIIGILFRARTPLTVRQIRRQYTLEMSAIFPEATQKLLQTEDMDEVKQKILAIKEAELSSFISRFNRLIKKAIPSYYRINVLLQNLEKQRIVSRRLLKAPVEKTLWFLTPLFARVCSYTFRRIEDKVINKRQSPSLTEKEVLIVLAGYDYYIRHYGRRDIDTQFLLQSPPQ